MNMRASQVSVPNRTLGLNRGTDLKSLSGVSGSNLSDSGSDYRENIAAQGLADSVQQRAQKNTAAFRTFLERAFGDKANPASLDSLETYAENGVLPLPANVRFVDAGTLGANTMSAYDSTNGGTTYIDRRLLNDPTDLESVYTKELGHHLTNLFNAQSVGRSDTLDTLMNSQHSEFTGRASGIDLEAGGIPSQIGPTSFSGSMFQPVSASGLTLASVSSQIEQLPEQPTSEAVNKIVSQIDAGIFEALSDPQIEKLALSLAKSDAFETALTQFKGPEPTFKHSLFARIAITNLSSSALTVNQLHVRYRNKEPFQSELASALAYKPGQSVEVTQKRTENLQQYFGTRAGREFLFGEGISGSDRLFALETASNHPELLTPNSAIEDWDTPLWETQGVSKLYAKTVFSKFTERGDVAFRVTGEQIDNYIGASLGLAPTPVDQRTSVLSADQLLANGSSVFEGNETIKPVVEEIKDLQSSVFDNQPIEISTVPILYTNSEIGAVQLQVYRVEANGTTRFVDNVGRSYTSVEQWKNNNEIPPGQITYAKEFTADGPLVSEVSHKTVDTWKEYLLSTADVAALVGGVVASGFIIAASYGAATPLVAGAWAVAGGSAAYTAYRAGGELTDRSNFGQTFNPLREAGARAAWLSLGASALTFVGGGLPKSATVVANGSTTAGHLGRAGAIVNTGANYVDALATGDAAHAVIKNWESLSPGQRAQGILQVAFWGGATAVSAKASGGNITDAFNLRIQTAQADISTGRAITEDAGMLEGHVSVVHSYDANGARKVEVRHAENASAVEIEIHSHVARELVSNQGLNGAGYRALGSKHNYLPNTRGEELHFEVSKHEKLVAHYESAVEGGAIELAPRLEQLRTDLAMYNKVLIEMSSNPSLANAEGLGQIDASPRFNYKKPTITAAEARAAFEPKDGIFANFDEYKLAVRADWKPLASTTYKLEDITVRTDHLGRPSTISGTVNPERNVGRIGRVDTALGKTAGAVKDDIGFHLGADQLGFMGGPLNLVPGNKVLNNSAYKALENKLRNYYEKGLTVEVEFKAIYNPGNIHSRPDGFKVEYSVESSKPVIEIFNNNGDKFQQ